MSPVYKPEHYDFLYEKSSRNRILVTAKTLFATLGYDNTSTAVIARNAGTSESQLMKHFGGKANLLETIFSEGWERINNKLAACFQAATDLNARLSCIPGTVFESLDEDLELKTLLLLEGHRMRDVARKEPAREGYARFLRLIDEAIAEAEKNGEIRSHMPSLPLRSAIVGMVVSGARQQVLASRSAFPANYGSEEIRTLLSAFLSTIINDSFTHGRHARVA
ncbi:MAG: TetR/AcrR family transcriptional regulator [Terriglobia bacterium]